MRELEITWKDMRVPSPRDCSGTLVTPRSGVPHQLRCDDRTHPCQQELNCAPVSGAELCAARRLKSGPLEGCGGFSWREP